MCGIVGIWGQADDALVHGMMQTLVHRGPDAAGTHSDTAGSLGHRRLSIMDPAHGDQPIYSEDGSRAVIANGEIYNFPGLSKQLAPRHTFRTRSDSESALHLYEELGSAVAARLDGMFALAIADGKDLFLARDPVGIKPLYYGTRANALVFASELKTLDGVAEETREFPNGTWFHSKVGLRRYYSVPRTPPRRLPLARRVADLRQMLESVVVKRLMSDVPVGAFLSGGLDSSLIAAIARRHLDQLHTFSVGIEGSHDLEAAREVARHLDTIHHEYVFTAEEVRAALAEIIYHLESFDQDLVRSAIPCYFVSRLASDYVKVVLTGEGADELFAGYGYYREIEDPQALHKELRRSVSSLHNINLQRVDRLTMAHSIEARVPFLDVEMIRLAQSIPPAMKLYRNREGRVVEKWILRKACADLLPSHIVWRDKEQFDEGSGTLDVIASLLEYWLPAENVPSYRQHGRAAGLRSAEECVYHKLLVDAFSDPDSIVANVARWSERPPYDGRGEPGQA